MDTTFFTFGQAESACPRPVANFLAVFLVLSTSFHTFLHFHKVGSQVNLVGKSEERYCKRTNNKAEVIKSLESMSKLEKRIVKLKNLEKMDIWQEMDVIENCPKVRETL